MPLRGALRNLHQEPDEDEDDQQQDYDSDEQNEDDEDQEYDSNEEYDDEEDYDDIDMDEIYEIVTEDSDDDEEDEEDELYSPLAKKNRHQLNNLYETGSKFEYDPFHAGDEEDEEGGGIEDEVNVHIDHEKGYAYIDTSSSHRMTAMFPKRKSLFFDEQTGQLIAVQTTQKSSTDRPLSTADLQKQQQHQQELIELQKRGYLKIIEVDDSSHRATKLFPSRFSLYDAIAGLDDGADDEYISSDEDDSFGHYDPTMGGSRRSFLRVRLYPHYDVYDPRNPETRKRARRGLKVDLDTQEDDISSLGFNKWMKKNDLKDTEQKFTIIPRSGEDPIEFQRRVGQAAAAAAAAAANRRITVRLSRRVSRAPSNSSDSSSSSQSQSSPDQRRSVRRSQRGGGGGSARQSRLAEINRQARLDALDSDSDPNRRVSFAVGGPTANNPRRQPSGGNNAGSRFAKSPTAGAGAGGPGSGGPGGAAPSAMRKRNAKGRRAIKIGGAGIDDDDEYYLPAGYSKWQKRDLTEAEIASLTSDPSGASSDASGGSTGGSSNTNRSGTAGWHSAAPGGGNSGGQMFEVSASGTVAMVDGDDPLARRYKQQNRRGGAAGAPNSPTFGSRAAAASNTTTTSITRGAGGTTGGHGMIVEVSASGTIASVADGDDPLARRYKQYNRKPAGAGGGAGGEGGLSTSVDSNQNEDIQSPIDSPVLSRSAGGTSGTKQTIDASGRVIYIEDSQSRKQSDDYDDPLARRRKPRRPNNNNPNTTTTTTTTTSNSTANSGGSGLINQSTAVASGSTLESSPNQKKEEFKYVPMGFNKWQSRAAEPTQTVIIPMSSSPTAQISSIENDNSNNQSTLSSNQQQITLINNQSSNEIQLKEQQNEQQEMKIEQIPSSSSSTIEQQKENETKRESVGSAENRKSYRRRSVYRIVSKEGLNDKTDNTPPATAALSSVITAPSTGNNDTFDDDRRFSGISKWQRQSTGASTDLLVQIENQIQKQQQEQQENKEEEENKSKLTIEETTTSIIENSIELNQQNSNNPQQSTSIEDNQQSQQSTVTDSNNSEDQISATTRRLSKWIS